MKQIEDIEIENTNISINWYLEKGILWVKYLPYFYFNLRVDTTREKLIIFFSRFGEVISGDIVACPFNGLCKVSSKSIIIGLRVDTLSKEKCSMRRL